MSQQALYNVTEEEFIKGIAEGKYTPNDAVNYCRGCFDKVGFLNRLFVYTFATDYPTERERAFISNAKNLVHSYLISEGHKVTHNYENWGIELDKKRATNYFSVSQEEQEKAVRDVLANYPELVTERAIKYITRAIGVRQKYILYRLNGKGFEWVYGKELPRGAKARLGYFCLKVFMNPRPISALETLFGTKNLDASITQGGYEAKRADVKRWRAEIDKDIFFD